MIVEVAAAASSGGGEEYGEYDILCSDIKKPIDAGEDKLAELIKRVQERNN